MSSFVYSCLLRLLPRTRRARYGDEMAAVFGQLRATAMRDRGWRGVVALWMSEIVGIARFAARSRRWPAVNWHMRSLVSECKWAWRGVRSRGARAVVAMLLLGVTLGANTLVFGVTDALVLNRMPFLDAATLVEIHSRDARGRVRSLLHIDAVDAWRAHTDLFAGVHGYADRTTFLVHEGRQEIESIVDVTPGLLEMLGAAPRWGRSLGTADTLQIDVQAVVISESLARARFGDPSRGPGQQLQTATEPLLVVGVVDDAFKFPRSSSKIWRAFDPRGPLGRSRRGTVQTVARLAPSQSLDSVGELLAQRSPAVAAVVAGTDPSTVFVPSPLATTTNPHGPLPWLLMIAAMCLLVTACANVASLELAGAIARGRSYAVQLALGASRMTLARVASLEGAMIIAPAMLLGAGLAIVSVPAVEAALPASLRFSSGNVIDVDARALAFMAAIAAFSWILATVPVAIAATRPRLLQLLNVESRSATASRAGAIVRQWLTATEVTLAVLLLATAALALGNYRRLTAFNKGFDSAGLAELRLILPPHMHGRHLAEQMLDELRAIPGVLGATIGTAPPMFGESWGGVKLEVDGRRATGDDGVSIVVAAVPHDYLQVLGLPIKAGRGFEPGDSPSSIIVTEDFARRFWPDKHAIGALLRTAPDEPIRTVIGVVPRLPPLEEALTGKTVDRLVMFSPRPPLPPPAPEKATAASGGLFSYASVIIRLDARDRGPELLRQVRAIDPRFAAELRWTDDQYASRLEPALLTARVVGAFGVLAFVVSMAGVYAVIAFLIATRTREIGIRLALGAARADIRRLVFSSSLRMVLAGAVIGLGGAYALAEVARSSIAGIIAFDMWTYLALAAVVVVTAGIATWSPARHATAVDPAVTLRE